MQDAFENEMDRRARELGGSWFDAKVAGVTMRNPDGSDRQAIARTLEPYDELTLTPEPENSFDKHAIALYTPGGDQVGYLEARLALEVSRTLRRGGSARAYVRTLRSRGENCGISFALIVTAAAAQA